MKTHPWLHLISKSGIDAMLHTEPSDAASSPDKAGSPPASSGLAWRLNRLRCMSVAEIGHRLLRSIAIQNESHRLHVAVPNADTSKRAPLWIRVPAGIDKAPYLAAADRLMAGRFDIFAMHNIDLGSPPCWNRDPKTGIEAPLSFGKLLDYRDPQQVGDIKYLWEPNRHLHLVTLAQAWALSGQPKYAKTIVRHLDNWFVTCPHGQGPNWTSALEVAIRLTNWSATWQLLGGVDSPLFELPWCSGFRERWLASIHQHASFIRGYFSGYSSANNHLIGEASGLFLAALTWPHWPESEAWRETAQGILEHETRVQNAPDGINREQAVAYQQFVIDLLLLPLLAGRANEIKFAADYAPILERMLDYLASIMDVGGHVPMFGDNDDGQVLKLGQDNRLNQYQSSLALGAVLFRRADFMHKAGKIDDKTRWLMGSQVDLPLPVDKGKTLPVRRAFPEGGYYILGNDFETDDEIRLIADAGPVGYQHIAAHGHADALSFTLSVGGKEFLIDPGTYAYHTEGPWRQYFRGTSAHNTVRVDGVDQSVPGGNFMWLHKAKAGCQYWQTSATEDIFEGWHDGYQRLSDPVRHQRRIILNKARRRIIIEDRLQMFGEHDIELFFHCGEQCEVEARAYGYLLSQGERQVLLKLPKANNTSHPIYHGNPLPILGWVSRSFDEKQPTNTLIWSSRLRGPTLLCSEIQC